MTPLDGGVFGTDSSAETGIADERHLRRSSAAGRSGGRSASLRSPVNFTELVSGADTVRRFSDSDGDYLANGSDERDFFDAQGGGVTPEVDLWRGVILRAWGDSFEVGDSSLAQSADTAATERADARAFLVAEEGTPWGDSRINICLNAGVCPERLRRRALEMLADEATVSRDLASLARREHLLDPEHADRLLEELLSRPTSSDFSQ